MISIKARYQPVDRDIEVTVTILVKESELRLAEERSDLARRLGELFAGAIENDRACDPYPGVRALLGL
jgi:hypothetical protein